MSICWLRGGFCVVFAVSLILGTASAFAVPHPIQIRFVDRHIEIGTDPSAPAYYVEYRTPDGQWHPWSSSTTLDPELNHLWFRGQFEPDDDPMAWEVPGGADIYSPHSNVLDPVSQAAWQSLGAFGDDGRLIAESPPDWMMQVMEASTEPEISYSPPANNQAVATPDPGTATLLFRRTNNNRTYVWHLSDQGVAKSETPVRDLNVSLAWSLAGTADISGNGMVDLVWRNTETGRVLIWFLDVDGVFSSDVAVSDVNLASHWNLSGITDVTSDGIPDLIWRNRETGRVFVWPLNEHGQYNVNDGFAASDVNLASHWDLRGIADVTSDGNPDLIWINTITGRVFVWPLNEHGQYDVNDGFAVSDINPAPPWELSGVADVNSSGRPDLIWRNRQTGRVYVWPLNADGQYDANNGFAVSDINLTSAWELRGIADVKGNGNKALVWHNSGSGRVFSWFLDANGLYDHNDLTAGQAASEVNLHPAWQIVSVED